MTNGMATTKLLMKADMLGKGVWQWAVAYFADRDIRTLGSSALGWGWGFSRLYKVPGQCLALGMGRAA